MNNTGKKMIIAASVWRGEIGAVLNSWGDVAGSVALEKQFGNSSKS